MVPEPTAHVRTLEFFESELFSAGKVVSSKSRHLRGCLDSNFCGSPKTLHSGWGWFSVRTFLEAYRNDRYPYHRLICSLRRNMTCPISALQSEDSTMGDTKSGFPSPICRFFRFFFQHVIRIAFVYSFKGGQVFIFVFFRYFLAKTSTRFFSKRPHEYTPTFKKRSWPVWIIWLYSWGSSVHFFWSKFVSCPCEKVLSLIHIWRCRRSTLCRSRWSPYH